jgi:hypothetical protein
MEAHRQRAMNGALGVFFNSKMLRFAVVTSAPIACVYGETDQTDTRSDVTIIIDGREIRAHKAVLGARSVQWRDIIADYEANQTATAGYWSSPHNDPEGGIAAHRTKKQHFALAETR